MPIVSHTSAASPQADGSSHVVLRYFDQDGKEYTVSFFLPAGVDLAPIIASREADLNEQLAQAEFEQIVGQG